MADSYVKLYRSSMLCDLLTDTLEELFEEQKLGAELAQRVLDVFDKTCLEALQKRAEGKALIQGNLKTYNYFDNVWQFELTDATFKLTPKAQGSVQSAPKLSADTIKLICVAQAVCEPGGQQQTKQCFREETEHCCREETDRGTDCKVLPAPRSSLQAGADTLLVAE
eukprot:TRINITY_DN6870_c0_g2_i3.p2 TRINITY_DN6870_c0_g2~~TRINITY_DN6870_c0_g2_i3.p2  ORF type:complete len:167 (+),score=14.94 TRINITY_DN6870_c0_g2_i3:331-831(+)